MKGENGSRLLGKAKVCKPPVSGRARGQGGKEMGAFPDLHRATVW